jgi:hypothetical protein
MSSAADETTWKRPGTPGNVRRPSSIAASGTPSAAVVADAARML